MTMIDTPAILSTLGGDTPRARRTDRVTSHIAADATQATIKVTKLRVLLIVLQEGPILGSELNDLYELRGIRNDWHPIHRDSPRKRAGELADDGFLDASETQQSAGNHLPEAEYRITDQGRAALRVTR